jgi:hypothetical protein
MDSRGYQARLLVNDAVWQQAPATASRQARITPCHEVMTDLPARWQESQIGNDAHPLSIGIEKIGIHKGWQPIQGDLIGFSGIPFNKDLLIIKSTTLIKTPHVSA